MDSQSSIKIFEHPSFGKIRTLTINGETWFVAVDVCNALGYQNPRDAIRKRVDSEDVAKRDTLSNGGIQSTTVINESGLYSLILSSKLPTTKKFKRWVTSEILPTIRKQGFFAVDDIWNVLFSKPANIAKILLKLDEEQKARIKAEETVALQSQQIDEMKPKASYFDEILTCPDPIPISQIAQDYGMSGKRLNQILKQLGVQYYLPSSQCWLLTSRYLGNNYTKIVPERDDFNYVKQHMYWTQKGRAFLYYFLKKHGFSPSVESDTRFLSD